MSVNVVITLFMMVMIMVLLLKEVSSPGSIFIFVSILGALIMGYGFDEINQFVGEGLKSVSSTAFLMMTAILYFGILHEAGVFNAIVKFVLRFLKNSVPGTMFIAATISILTQLDGAGATTALCTIPVMRPIFEKQKIRRESLLLIESLGSGVLCMIPWAPGIVEASSFVGVDVHEVFQFLIPLLFFSIVLVYVFCVLIALIEQKHGAGLTQEEFDSLREELDCSLKLPFGKKIALFDGIFTLVLIAALLSRCISSNIAFGTGYAILAMVNFREKKAQSSYMKKQAPIILNMVFTLFGVGVLVGINHGTGAINEFATFISENGSDALLARLPLILCLISMPLTITIGSARTSIILPTLMPIFTSMGYSAVGIVGCFFISGAVAANVSLFNASPYLALGLAGVEMKDHLKYSLLPIYGFSLLMVLFMVITGMLPI